MLKQRSTLGLILLSIITCGIYYIYWIYATTKSVNEITNDGNPTNPGLATILSIVFAGIYPIIWQYILGDKMNQHAQRYGVIINDTGTTYILWSIVGLLLFGLGPLISLIKFNSNHNTLVAGFNSSLSNAQ